MASRKPVQFRLKALQKAFDSVLSAAVAQKLRFIEQRETSRHRDLIVAGIYRLRCDKKTGRLSPGELKVASLGERAFRASARGPLLAPRMSAPQAKSLTGTAANKLLQAALDSFQPQGALPVSFKVWGKAIAILSRRLFGNRFQPQAAAFSYVGLTWNWLFDREIALLARRVFGYYFSFSDYNHVVEYRELVEQVQLETPNLLPLLGWCIREHHDEFRPSSLPPKDAFFRMRRSLMRPALRQEVALTAHGWKFLTRLSIEQVRACLQFGNLRRNLAENLNTLALTGERIIPLAFLRKLLNLDGTGVSLLHGQHFTTLDQRVRFIRLAIRAANHAKRRGQVRVFIADEYSLMLDWLLQRGCVEGFPLPTSTWESLLRRQAEWHERIAFESAEKRVHEHWTSLLEEQVIDGVHIIPLTSGIALAEEGLTMHHCVSTYAQRCMENKSRIFAIHGQGKNRATLELVSIRQNTGHIHWKVGQVRSFCNAPPSLATAALCKVVAQRYQRAQQKSDKAMKPLALEQTREAV